MRLTAIVFVFASLLTAGCDGSPLCTLEERWSFRAITCPTISEDSRISGDGSCSGAQFFCLTGENPCTQWGVLADGPGTCIVDLQDGNMVYQTYIELTAITDECRTDYHPISGLEDIEVGPGCE